jgi:hypothetical protein
LWQSISVDSAQFEMARARAGSGGTIRRGQRISRQTGLLPDPWLSAGKPVAQGKPERISGDHAPGRMQGKSIHPWRINPPVKVEKPAGGCYIQSVGSKMSVFETKAKEISSLPCTTGA